MTIYLLNFSFVKILFSMIVMKKVCHSKFVGGMMAIINSFMGLPVPLLSHFHFYQLHAA